MRNMRFSENLVRLLASHGKTQGELASGVGVNQASVSRWLDGTSMPRKQVLVKLADYFGISTDDLIQGAPPEPLPAHVARREWRVREGTSSRLKVAERLRREAQRLRESADRLEQDAASIEAEEAL